jgi:hypothetical protein
MKPLMSEKTWGLVESGDNRCEVVISERGSSKVLEDGLKLTM